MPCVTTTNGRIISISSNGGAARSTDRVRHEALVEAHSFARNTINVRRLIDTASVGADGVIGVVNRNEVEDVRSRRAGDIPVTAWRQRGPLEKSEGSQQVRAARTRHNRETLLITAPTAPEQACSGAGWPLSLNIAILLPFGPSARPED